MKSPVFVAFLALLAPLSAAPVAVGDFSFEGNSIGAGQWTNNLEPEWKETGGPNNGSGFEEYIPGFVADGTDHLGMNLGHNVWQDLAASYEPYTRYTLTVAAGHRSGSTQPGNQTQYLLADADGNIHATGIFDASTLPAQSFADAPPLVFETPGTSPAIGKPIRILLQARGSGRSHFDEIRLDAVNLVPPGGATLVNHSATAITTSTATLNGEVTGIGNDAPSVTLFWGTENGGINPAGWQHSLDLPGTRTGLFSGDISGLAAGTSYFFTARAINGAGVSWALDQESFETIPLPPSVENLAAADITATRASIGASVTSGGGAAPMVVIYYGETNGGTDPGAWESSVSLGSVNGTATTDLTGLIPATNYYFRARAESAGGEGWAAASATFTTLAVVLPAVENRSATGVTGTTANLRGEVTFDGNDPPSVTVFYGTGDGGAETEDWEFSSAVGIHAGEFARFVTGLQPQTVYYFRSRATNAAGSAWASGSLAFTTTSAMPDTAVINEFHYKPGNKTSLEEFIELHNPGDSPLDLSGWTLSDAISYTFPAGTTLPAGGYLVVSESPAVMLAKYGVIALGPWSGKLNSSGERIDLRDSGNVLRDRVDYGVGFPWPTGPDGGGSSAELIHPGLDNNLGGSWRASGFAFAEPVTYIVSQTTGWRYKRGTAEASNPVDAWRAIAYDDSGWETGRTGIGYNDPGVNTVLSDMRRTGGGAVPGYASVYFRKEFTVPSDAIPNQLRLRIRMDDGCVIWINGTEVHRLNVGAGQLAYNYLAPTAHENDWKEVILHNTDNLLFGGTNVVAVHGFNNTLGSSDFSMDLELATPGGGSPVPTPGAVNSVARSVDAIPPQLRQVAHTPISPAPGEEVVITARITDPDGVGAVTLSYQIVDPGAYIRVTDPAYATSWTTVTMRDDGTDGDVTPNDSIFTARIPASVQNHRRLVRYIITFADILGNSATVPYADDEQPNFAYFVHGGIPDWQGAFRPGSTPLQTFPPAVLSELPVYTLIANGTDVINSQYNSSFRSVRFRGTFVHDGKVYDHIEYRNRGEASTYVSGKNKWRFYFNRSRDLPVKDHLGTPRQETWGTLSGNACASPWAAVHRGMAGLDEALSFKAFELAGLPAPSTHHYHFRVVRGTEEAPPAGTMVNDPIGNADGQYAGDFWGLYLAVEQPRGSFLDERGLPDGNVYKIEGNGGDKKSQGVTQPVDSSDWNTFRNAHVNGNPTESWWRTNMDMDAYYTFHAISRLTGNVDLRGGNNHYFYHRSSDDRWVPIPWDLDMMFIAKSHWNTSIDGTSYPGVIHAYKSLLQNPALALEYRNRAREFLDLLASDGDSGGGQFGQLIDEFASIVNPAGQPLTWADADAAMWNLHPRTNGSDGSASGQSNHKGNFFRTTYSDSRMGGGWTRWLRSPASSGTMDHDDSMSYLRDYVTNAWPGGAWAVNNGNQLGYGYQYLASEAADPDIPQTPVISYAGEPGFPTSGLSFVSSAFADPQGPGTYAKTEWRMAEISGPGVPGYLSGTRRKYEIDPVWTEVSTGVANEMSLPFGVAEPGKAYRVRVRHQDITGRWSHWSAPVGFGATAPLPGLLLHYWNFNVPAEFLVPTTSQGGGELTSSVTDDAEVISHSSEDQGFAAVNARFGDSAGAHLRVNHPLGASLDFALPTTGHENIVIRYETRRSGQGAGSQVVSYAIDGSTFMPFATLSVADSDPVLRTLDFRSVPGADDNPLFALRIQFVQDDGGTAGNNRFDNFTVEGVALAPQPGTFAHWRAEHFTAPGELADDAISGPDAAPGADGIANIIRYAFGVGPGDPVVHLLPVLTWDPAIRFRFRYDPEKSDLRWKVTASADLEDWSQVLFDSASDPAPPAEGDWHWVGLPGVSAERGFVRLELELVAP